MKSGIFRALGLFSILLRAGMQQASRKGSRQAGKAAGKQEGSRQTGRQAIMLSCKAQRPCLGEGFTH